MRSVHEINEIVEKILDLNKEMQKQTKSFLDSQELMANALCDIINTIGVGDSVFAGIKAHRVTYLHRENKE